MRQPGVLARAVAVRARPWLQVMLAAVVLAALAAVSPAAVGGRDHGAARAGHAGAATVTGQVLAISSGAPRYAPTRSWLHRADPATRGAPRAGGQSPAVLASDLSRQVSDPAAGDLPQPGTRAAGQAAGGVGSRAPPLSPVNSWS